MTISSLKGQKAGYLCIEDPIMINMGGKEVK